ncbi:MAG: flavodoxin [Selenomonadaceae bacterium]|nr:flavodoxin [Selenomonadaceae bacterium]
MSKILVAYFSASGITAKVAHNLANAVNADIFEIEPKIRYDRADLDWNDKNSRTSIEMNDINARPEIATPIHVEGYDTIFIGFPIWWYTAPRIINTFFESADFTGKKVYLFATSGGSGLGDTVSTLKKICPAIISGKMLNRSTVNEMQNWVRSLLL